LEASAALLLSYGDSPKRANKGEIVSVMQQALSIALS